jgi:2-polyprenyl-6-methoxyphenol hydroxylase-like FAD-dependent oxidoreductase
MSNMQRKHALVIGGSMAGLLAARALSDHFEQVTILERDQLPDSADFRSGVPQGRHLHALLAEGQRVLESFFPGFTADLTAMGAPTMQWGRETASLTPGGWLKRIDTSITTNVATRVGLEWLTRKHVAALPNVIFIQEVEVDGLLASEGQVIGVRLRDRRDQSTRTMQADFVVDASGRKSKAPEWLVTLGYSAPEETIVNSFVGYATRWYEADRDFDWVSLVINARPKENLKRGGGIIRVEGNRWLVTLAGVNKDYPPNDEVGFLEYARTLASPVLYEIIKNAKPISPVYGFRYDGSRRRHFERLTRRPENFIVIGDAACSFNPIYGQGMTSAALSAEALATLLRQYQGRDNLNGLAAQFQRALFNVSERAWLMATGEDLRYPGTEGKRPNAMERFVQRYIDRLLTLLPHDDTIALAFMEAMNLSKPPAALLRPSIALRVLRYAFAKPHPVSEYKLTEQTAG